MIPLRLKKKEIEKLLGRKEKASRARRPRTPHYRARVRCGKCGKWRTTWTGDRLWYVCPDCGHRGCRFVHFLMPHLENHTHSRADDATQTNNQLKEVEMLYQQGDILIQEVAEIPRHAVRIAPDQHRNTLAEGEATGHAHRVVGFVEMFRKANDPQGDTFMSAPKRIEIRHQEHISISLPEGVYKVSRVREYDHFAEEARSVQD